jgi:cytochrome c peroxidase
VIRQALVAVVGVAVVAVAGALGVAVGRAEGRAAPSAWTWDLPAGFPIPKVPADNPMSAEKVALGRRLFYDTRLSGNRSFSCATCHVQARAFADPLPRAVGSTGEVHPRNSMSLGNVAYAPVLTWANPNLRRLEQQALIPMFGEHPVELGLAGKEGELLGRVREDTLYRRLFAAAFPDAAGEVSLATITKALAAFQRTLISANSPYDRFQRGDRAAVSSAARRGEALFFSERLECFHCHGGFNFTGTADYVGKGFAEVEFHNTGLYNVGGRGAYPAENPGLLEHSGDPEDMGKFKAPSLRNVAVTAPYMHDGSIPTLDAVIDHYAAGGRTVRAGPHAGVGRRNPFKSGFVKGFTLTPRERNDLTLFLHALTDSTFLTDPRFSDPWTAARRPE